MSYVLCAPVVSQIGLIGSVPPEGLWEPWCEVDEERWTTLVQRVDLQVSCAPHGGEFRWQFEPSETFGIDVFDLRTEPILDLRGKRVYFRLRPGFGVGNEFIFYIVDRWNPQTGFFERAVDWAVVTEPGSDLVRPGATGLGPVGTQPWGAYGPEYRWLAYRFAPDGRTVWLEHSADCEEWTVGLEVPVPEGSPSFGAAVGIVHYGAQASQSTEGMTGGAISSIYIETVGAGDPEATP